MSGVLLSIDQFLRGEGLFSLATAASAAPRDRVRAQVRIIVLCGALYGGVMGSFGGVGGEGWRQILLSAAKVPFLFLVTFLLCVLPFYVMNALAGLRDDFSRVADALLSFQSLAAVVLAALAPITLLMNVSANSYPFIKLWNGVVFAVASFSGHYLMRKLYRPLIFANTRHAIFLNVWIALFTFVGIQMAWVLRPFVGSPGMPFEIFRREAWGNAYLEILNLILRLCGHP